MKTTNKISYRLIIVLLFTSVFCFANNPVKGKYKKTKTVTKDFTVDATNTVSIDNKYGDLIITTWNENVVSIVVTITAKSKNEERVEKKLNDINITFDQSGTHVYAKTNIESRSNWSLFSFGNKANVDFSIDYEIKMPLSNNVNLENDYGSIYIDKLEGVCILDCDYGGIHLGELHNKHNEINMDYGHASNIDFINSGKINSDYSRLTIEKANDINLKADYSHFEIATINKLKYNNDYGSIKLGEAQNVEGNGDYLSLKVEELSKSFNVNCDYGSIKIYKLHRNFNNVTINTDYTGIKVGVSNACSFNFDTTTSYADISFEYLDVEYTFKEEKKFTKIYKGTVNGGNPNATINIQSSYGGIKLYKAEE